MRWERKLPKNCYLSIYQVSFYPPLFIRTCSYSLSLGWNTTISFRTFEGSIPALPKLGKAISNITIDLPAPRLTAPKNPGRHDDPDEDTDGPRFIDDATVKPILASIELPTDLERRCIFSHPKQLLRCCHHSLKQPYT